MRTREEVREEVLKSLAGWTDSVMVSDVWIDNEVERIMNEEKYARATTDWEAELGDDEVIENDQGRRIVLLRGLQRLARVAGIRESYPESLTHVVGPDGKGVIQCLYITKWNDGSTFGATADANKGNLNPDFLAFPTTIAESRAEGRAIRKALGITLLTAEELDTAEGFTGQTKAESGKADSAQVAALEKLLEDSSVVAIDVISEVVKDGREVLDLADLSPSEAVEAMRYLNDQRTTGSKRDARKAALQNKVK